MKRFIEEMENRGYEAKVVKTNKNGVTLEGLNIGKAGDRIRPVVYANNELLCMSISEACDKMEEFYDNRPSDMLPDSSLLSDNDYIKENSIVCIQRKTGNDSLVKRDFLDLEIYIRCQINNEMSYCIKDVMDVPGIWEAATQNTKDIFKLKSLFETVKEMNPDLPIPEDEFNQYVITSKSNHHGASALLFPELFADICKKEKCAGCYILPSSIHELIVIPDDGTRTKNELDEMVQAVNSEVLDATEFLSDHVYYFILATNEITY